MNITLTGASGFIGGVLVDRLLAKEHKLTLLGRSKPRNPAVQFAPWDSIQDPFPPEAADGADAIIHMAGEPVAQRWNDDVKKRIRESRVNGTRQLVQAMRKAARPPRTLIAASAIGFYGDRGNEELNEWSRKGTGFLPDVCAEWEEAALEAQRYRTRVVIVRIGIVLHASGGALKTMLPFFRMGLGGPVGTGRQWMSWIHRDDLVSMLIWALENEKISGVLNGVSAEPVRNADFGKALGDAVKRPAVMPAPSFALRLLYGEMASVVLASQRVVPQAPLGAGFTFQYPDLAGALEAALAK